MNNIKTYLYLEVQTNKFFAVNGETIQVYTGCQWVLASSDEIVRFKQAWVGQGMVKYIKEY